MTPTPTQNPDPARDSDELFHDKVRTETAKVFVEIEKMRAETAKMQSENQWYPAIVASTVTLVIVAVTKFVFIIAAIQMRKG